MTQLSRASYTEALTMLRFGVAVRREAMPLGDYVRRIKVKEPVPDELPPIKIDSVWEIRRVRWIPTQADLTASDWSEI